MTASRAHRDLVVFDLRFGPDLDHKAVQAFLGALSGLLPQRRQQPFVALEVHARRRGILHRLVAPEPMRASIEAALAAHLPSVVYTATTYTNEVALDPGDEPLPLYPELLSGVEFTLTTRRPLLVDEHLGPRLLATLGDLGRDEVVVVQVIVSPAAGAPPPRARADGAPVDAVAAERRKYEHPLLVASLRIGALASTRPREIQLTGRAGAAWRSARAPGVSLARRRLRPGAAARRIRRLHVPRGRWPVLLNSAEAASLIGWPTGDSPLPGVDRRTSAPLPVPAALPTRGTIVGEGSHPRTRRTVALATTARRHGLIVTGPTGSGKSVLATRLAVGDVAKRGNSLVVIDPKDGELVDRICSQLPDERLDDVIVLDPTDDRPVGFDPLAGRGDDHELLVDRVLHLMHEIWGSNVGPRSDDILRHLLLTISAVDGLTMTEAPALLSDPAFRHRVLAAHQTPPGVREWWTWFDSLGEREAAAMVQAPLNKLRAFVSRRAVAAVLGQTAPALDIPTVLNSGSILLVRLPAGLLGEETTALLGAMILTQVTSAIAARASIEPSKRRPASLIIDEAATVLRFPAASIENLFATARGYGVSITALTQHLGQLSTSMRSTVMTNARSAVVFAPSHEDATVWSRHFGGRPSPADLQGLDAYHAVAALFAEGRTQAPTTIATLPLGPPLRDPEVVKALSRERHGVDREVIHESIRARREPPASEAGAPIGRRRRTR